MENKDDEFCKWTEKGYNGGWTTECGRYHEQRPRDIVRENDTGHWYLSFTRCEFCWKTIELSEEG